MLRDVRVFFSTSSLTPSSLFLPLHLQSPAKKASTPSKKAPTPAKKATPAKKTTTPSKRPASKRAAAVAGVAKAVAAASPVKKAAPKPAAAPAKKAAPVKKASAPANKSAPAAIAQKVKTPASPAKLASLERARAAKAVKRALELKAGGGGSSSSIAAAVAGPIKVIKKVRAALFPAGGELVMPFFLPLLKKNSWPCQFFSTHERFFFELQKKLFTTDPRQARREEARPAAEEVCQEDAVAQVEWGLGGERERRESRERE